MFEVENGFEAIVQIPRYGSLGKMSFMDKKKKYVAENKASLQRILKDFVDGLELPDQPTLPSASDHKEE